MKIKKALEGGKRILAGILFIGVGVAPQVVPIVAPEYIPLIPVGQGVASAIGVALVGASKWNSMKKEQSDANTQAAAGTS